MHLKYIPRSVQSTTRRHEVVHIDVVVIVVVVVVIVVVVVVVIVVVCRHIHLKKKKLIYVVAKNYDEYLSRAHILTTVFTVMRRKLKNEEMEKQLEPNTLKKSVGLRIKRGRQ